MFNSDYTHFACDADLYTSGSYNGMLFINLNYGTNYVGNSGVTIPSDAIEEEKESDTNTSDKGSTKVEEDADFASIVKVSSFATAALLAQSLF